MELSTAEEKEENLNWRKLKLKKLSFYFSDLTHYVLFVPQMKLQEAILTFSFHFLVFLKNLTKEIKILFSEILTASAVSQC